MNYLFVFFLFIGSNSLFAQEPDTMDFRSPKIICSVKLGETANFGEQSVKFVKVLSDSRCPKNVTCVWEGEAIVLIELFRQEERMEKEFVISSKTKNNVLFSYKNNSVRLYGLAPYPDSNKPKTDKDYELRLILMEEGEQ